MPPKPKPEDAGYQKLKKDLVQGGTPGQLYVFHGEETYLRDYYLGRLREQILSGGMGEFNLHEIKGKDMSPHALEEAVDCLPMMAERTLVLITDYDLFKAGDKTADAILQIVYSYLGQLIANVCNVLNPEIVIIGGGVSKAGQCIIDGVRPYFMKDAFIGVKKVDFALAELGNDAGAYGAFKLVL